MSLPDAYRLALAMLPSDPCWDKRTANQRRAAFSGRGATPATKTSLGDGANVETSTWFLISRTHRGNCCAALEKLQRLLVA
jgi:hypothetical protein